MSIDKFAQSLLFAFKNNIQDDKLLSKDIRGFRSGYFFGLIIYLNKVINYFGFKNEIIFTNKKPYIKIYSQIHTNHISNDEFIRMLNLNGNINEQYWKNKNLIKNIFKN